MGSSRGPATWNVGAARQACRSQLNPASGVLLGTSARRSRREDLGGVSRWLDAMPHLFPRQRCGVHPGAMRRWRRSWFQPPRWRVQLAAIGLALRAGPTPTPGPSPSSSWPVPSWRGRSSDAGPARPGGACRSPRRCPTPSCSRRSEPCATGVVPVLRARPARRRAHRGPAPRPRARRRPGRRRRDRGDARGTFTVTMQPGAPEVDGASRASTCPRTSPVTSWAPARA